MTAVAPATGGNPRPLPPEPRELRRDDRLRRAHHAAGIASAAALGFSIYLVAGPAVFSVSDTQNVEWLTDGNAAAAIAEGEEYYRAEVADKPVGYAKVVRMKLGADALITQTMELNLVVQKIRRNVKTESAVVTSTTGALKRFKFDLESADSKFSVLGEVKGKVIDLWFREGESERATRIEVHEPPVMDLNLTRLVAARGLKAGAAYKVNVFDPQTLSNRPTVMHVVAKEPIEIDGTMHDGWRIEQENDGTRVRMWIKDNGEGLLAEGPLGMKLVRTSRANALGAAAESQTGAGPDLIERAVVKPDRPPALPFALTKLRLRVGGLSDTKWDLDGGRQAWDEQTGIVTIARDNPPATATGLTIEKVQELARHAALNANDGNRDHFNVKSSSIQLKSSELVHGFTNPFEAVQRVHNWIFNALTKVNVISIPSAVEVLQTLRGDCNEHATLMVALLRAAGIPARMAAGVVYFPPYKGFAYHAWVEYWAGEWYTSDPTLDQFPADATHLRLVAGDFARQMRINGIVGQLKIDVIDWEPAGAPPD